MSKEPKNVAIPHFQRLSSSISLHTPSNAAKGQLVILATWLGGTAKHISKYIALYNKMFPDVRILHIKSFADSVLFPYPIQRRTIRPAIPPVLQILGESEDAQSNAHIIMHVFSNGGIARVTQLIKSLRQELGAPLPLSGLIFDSAPAVGGVQMNYNGFMNSVPNGVIPKLIGLSVTCMSVFILETSIALGRYARPEMMYREDILDDTLIRADKKGGDRSKKRVCYFGSKADSKIPYEDILSHAEEAGKRGWDVDVHLWDDTAHCSHIVKHPDEYRDAVKNIWVKSKL